MTTNVIHLGSTIIISAVIVASAAIFGIQSVAAQTEATSTPPADTESGEQPAEASAEAATTSDSTALGAATTTEAAPEPASTSTSATTTVAASEPASAVTSTPPTPPASEVVDITDAPTAATVTADIATLEDEYFQKTGSYLQILRGNGLPTYESGGVTEKLGKNVAEDVWVHVYEAPAGKGYQVLYEADGVLHSVGYGPEASERTFTRSTVSAPSATSTAPTAL